MRQNSGLPKGKKVFNINHTVSMKGLGTVNSKPLLPGRE
jgi:hypothetical protein